MWDPRTYLNFADERSRPFRDLVAQIHAEAPAEVVDLGCGPGGLTVQLCERWPDARVRGLDSSADMIDSARALNSRVEFALTDVNDWHPGPEVGVVTANAVLQWVPGHEHLLRGWVQELAPRSWLAFQVPGNFTAPSHRSIAEVAARPRFRDRTENLLGVDSVLEPAQYAASLAEVGCAVDAWETTYLHLLPATGPKHPVLAWVEGTALRPVRAVLDDADWAAFCADLTSLFRELYPIHNGLVYFPFRRIFVVART